MLNLKENKTKKWTGTYRGVTFEINNWDYEYNGDIKENWTYYLILYLDRIPEENKPNSYWLKSKKYNGRVIYDYYKHPIINDIDFHCGCTWYSKERGFDGEGKVIKIGCDYAHYWDVGQYYNLNYVTTDVQHTIDKFLEHVPGYKYWCCGNGKLYDLSEGIVKNDRFYSKEYFGDKLDEFKTEIDGTKEETTNS